jgi:hypothetical protein
MPDQIINAVMAHAIYADAVRSHPLVGWIVMRDVPDYPDEFVARLVTDVLTSYVVVADTLAELHVQLPPGMERLERQPSDPPEVIEVWFAR